MIKSLAITIVQSYIRKNIAPLLLLALLPLLRTHNNTDSNKVMIFSSIALYCGDTLLELFVPLAL